MTGRYKSVYKALAWGLISLLTSCQAPPPTAPHEAGLLERSSEAQSIVMPETPMVVYLNPEKSGIQLLIYRAGRLAHLGHNHIISAPVKGMVRLHPDIRKTAFRLVLNVNEFVVDDAAARAKAGAGFASPVTAQAIIDTRNNMLGHQVLDAINFPYIDIQSVSVKGELPQLESLIAVTLKGIKQTLKTTILVTRNGTDIVARGSFVISQQQFNLKPFSILGGAIAVADKIDIRYHLVIPTGDSSS